MFENELALTWPAILSSSVAYKCFPCNTAIRRDVAKCWLGGVSFLFFWLAPAARMCTHREAAWCREDLQSIGGRY